MVKLPCYLIQDILPLYVDDLVNDQTRRSVDEHMLDCDECRKISKKLSEELLQESDIETNSKEEINVLKAVKRKLRIRSYLEIIIPVIIGFLIMSFVIFSVIWTVHYKSDEFVLQKDVSDNQLIKLVGEANGCAVNIAYETEDNGETSAYIYGFRRPIQFGVEAWFEKLSRGNFKDPITQTVYLKPYDGWIAYSYVDKIQWSDKITAIYYLEIEEGQNTITTHDNRELLWKSSVE